MKRRDGREQIGEGSTCIEEFVSRSGCCEFESHSSTGALGSVVYGVDCNASAESVSPVVVLVVL